MGDIDTAVRGAQQLEGLLEQRFGAVGRGLHEKLSSVESHLPQALVRQVRWIAALRNRVVHEAARIDNVDDFERAVAASAKALSELPATKTIASESAADFGLPNAAGFRAPTASSSRNAAPTAASDSGSLAGLAQRATHDAQQAGADIDALWSTLQRTTRVRLGEPDVKDNGDGTSDVLVPVTWEVDARQVLATLNKYFWDYQHGPIHAEARTSFDDKIDFGDHIGQPQPVLNAVDVNRVWNKAEDPKRPFSPELFTQLASRVARVRVGAGSHSGTVTFAAGRWFT